MAIKSLVLREFQGLRVGKRVVPVVAVRIVVRFTLSDLAQDQEYRVYGLPIRGDRRTEQHPPDRLSARGAGKLQVVCAFLDLVTDHAQRRAAWNKKKAVTSKDNTINVTGPTTRVHQTVMRTTNAT